MSSILGNVLTTLASKALDAAVGFVQTGIEYNAQIEKYTTGFTNMLGSAEAAQQAMGAIQEDAARTPFNVEALTQANQLLISAGENAGYSRKVIMALGDAVSATGGGNDELSRMAANLQQIANVGKASAIDIKQFAYAGINVYADGKITTTVNQTCDKVVLSVSEMQSRIDKNLSEAKTKWQNGIMGTLQSVLTDLKNGNWTSLATDFAKLIWGEVTQEQRNIISKWFSDALTAINDSYSGGGMSSLKDTLHKLLTDGITSDANDAKVAVQGLSQVINGLGESGGMGAKLAGIAGNFSGMAGVITKALSGIVGFIIANPVVAAILGLTALVGGAAFAKWRSSRDNDVTNNYKSPYGTTPVYDSLAEFSARADQLNRYSSVTASPFAGSQQDTTGKQQLSVLQRISNLLDEHLPAIGTGTLVIDANGVQALAGAMQPTLTNGIDGDLGIRAARKARGG